MEDTAWALKTFKNKLAADFEKLTGELQKIFDKALLDGQTNPLIVFADFIGSSQALLGSHLGGKGKQPAK